MVGTVFLTLLSLWVCFLCASSYKLHSLSVLRQGLRNNLRFSSSTTIHLSQPWSDQTSTGASFPKARRSWSKSGGLVENQLTSSVATSSHNTKPAMPSTSVRRPSLALVGPQLVLCFQFAKKKTEAKAKLQRLQDNYQSENGKFKFSEQAGSVTTKKNGGGRGEDVSTSLAPKFATKKVSLSNSNSGAGKTSSAQKRRRTDMDDDSGDNDARTSERDEGAFDSWEHSDVQDAENTNYVSAGTVTLVHNQCGRSVLRTQEWMRLGYGVDLTIQEIERRLDEERMVALKGRKGKSRRDRSNARASRHQAALEDRQPGVRLPLSGTLPLTDLATKLDLSPATVIGHLIANEGILVAVGQSVTAAVARRVARAFGKKLADASTLSDAAASASRAPEVSVQSAPPRSPVVTIMGHVDHGKTTLLDRLRRASVAATEVGGITQGISAFSVPVTSQDGASMNVTFIDTPGHAAFSAMRTRGARVTDIVVLVVAADDGVMEQTKECIYAAQEAGCPLVVAINKMDKEDADPSRAVAGLLEEGVLLEEFGGETQCAHVSGRTGAGLGNLLEKILMQAEIMDLRSPVLSAAKGTVLECRKDKGLGLVVSAIVQEGTLSVGDYVLAGQASGRVRRLISDQGISIPNAHPSTPVQIVGLSGETAAGDVVGVVENETGAKEAVDARERIIKIERGRSNVASAQMRAASLTQLVEGGAPKEVISIPVLIKCDVAGSAEAIRSAVETLEQSDDASLCAIDIVQCSAGDVTTSDISTAAAFKAQIVAFNVGCSASVQTAARKSGVSVLYFSIIYELLDELNRRILQALAPPLPGALQGRLLVKKVFKIGKSSRVVGCELLEGTIDARLPVRVVRNLRQVIHTGTIASMKIGKEAVSEISSVGKECGIALSDFTDIEEGDILENFSVTSTDDQNE